MHKQQFAPGVIDGPYRTRRQVRPSLIVMSVVALAIASAAFLFNQGFQ